MRLNFLWWKMATEPPDFLHFSLFLLSGSSSRNELLTFLLNVSRVQGVGEIFSYRMLFDVLVCHWFGDLLDIDVVVIVLQLYPHSMTSFEPLEG